MKASFNTSCFVRSCRRRRHRTGMILLLVLIVIVALSVAIYSYSRHMLIDMAIARAKVDAAQQQLLADSVVEQLLVSDRPTLHRYCRPIPSKIVSSLAVGKQMFGANGELGVASVNLPGNRIGYMAMVARDPQAEQWHIGLANESAKLNLNSLMGKRLSRKQVVAKLMKFRDLSESTAEGIANVLGVFDSQAHVANDPTTSGAARQRGPQPGLASLEELLNIPGVTEERLFGEDRNANGILDWNEDDGAATWPADNANGVLDAGWSGDWTLIGAESNFLENGQRKIDLNQADLVSLYDEISRFATPEEARFVVAWRMSSPVYTDVSSLDESLHRAEAANELATSFDDRLAMQLGQQSPTPSNSTSSNEGTRDLNVNAMRAGLDLAVKPSRRFRSLLDLASCQLQLIVEGKDTILVSPFANDPHSLAQWLPHWEARTSLAPGEETSSRINILQASHATLTTVEGISEELAKAIIDRRTSLWRAEHSDVSSLLTSVAWLLESGLVTTAQLRRMADEITVGGDVFQGYAIGQLQMSRTAQVKFFELDGRGATLQVRRAMDLLPLSAADKFESAQRSIWSLNGRNAVQLGH